MHRRELWLPLVSGAMVGDGVRATLAGRAVSGIAAAAFATAAIYGFFRLYDRWFGGGRTGRAR